MSLDKKSQLPLYAQLMKEIKDQIRKGTYKEGDQIPTEGELSAAYQVSRITVRRTIEELCSQGFLVKRQGKGTFVEIPKIYRKIENDNNMSFSEACRSNGRKPFHISFPVILRKCRNGSRIFLNLNILRYII